MRQLLWCCIGIALVPIAATSAQAMEPAPGETNSPDFAAEVLPIFQQHCVTCHGDDAQESGLRLDRRADALTGGDSGAVIVPGDSQRSRLYQLIAALDEDERMPPDGDLLVAADVDVIRRWIDDGAIWPDDGSTAGRRTSDHWSFQPIVRPELPPVENTAWPHNEIDAFVLAQLESRGVDPSPAADRPTLIRRLSLDLTGLLPTPDEVDAFVTDERPDAYTRLVRRLLDSEHFGERWGRHWLDLARYADSDGYEKDRPRPHAWRYRNWVIDAINADLPFDQFTIEQLAGDLLPDATLEQRVATGFHRNTLTNREGGIDPEEDRVKKTVDRTNTTAQVFLGLTLACAQCHSHKYDPFTQREYYSFYGFFNSQQEQDVPAPLGAEASAYDRARAAYDQEHAPLVKAVAAYEANSLAEAQRAWEESLDLSDLHWAPLDPARLAADNGTQLTRLGDLSIRASGDTDKDTYHVTAVTGLSHITAIRIETLTDSDLPESGPGLANNGNFVVNDFSVTLRPFTDASSAEPVELEFGNAYAPYSQKGFAVARAVDDEEKTGWAVSPNLGRNHTAVFELASPTESDTGSQLEITIKQIHGKRHLLGRFRISVTNFTGPERRMPAAVRDALAVAPDARTKQQSAAIADFYGTIDPELLALEAAVAKHAETAPTSPSTQAQILTELADARPTHVHVRGNFLQPGDPVDLGTPAVLPPIESRAESADRLDLARWIASPENPLTARVAVNRAWSYLFGRGLTPTVEDFGTQGEAPSHPQLLDWLADYFVSEGWSRKRLIETIVHSATYRQSSATRPELEESDPTNVWLARQNRFRLEAEVVRDAFLSASGLLNPAIGGPSVRPPLPSGVAELGYANQVKWSPSTGSDRYRRGLYVFFQRTVPYPMLVSFDAPDSNTACSRRERSNTPLQALTLLNDPVFFECAQHLARRVVAEAPADPRLRARHAFRIGLAREPDANELDELLTLHATVSELARADLDSAQALVGEGLSTDDVLAHAPWVIVARTIMNLDEFYTRQ